MSAPEVWLPGPISEVRKLRLGVLLLVTVRNGRVGIPTQFFQKKKTKPLSQGLGARRSEAPTETRQVTWAILNWLGATLEGKVKQVKLILITYIT